MDFYFLGLVMLILLTGVLVSTLVNRRRARRVGSDPNSNASKQAPVFH
jgi:predicted Zn-dependent protease